MLAITQTVTVNAAFLQEIKEDDRVLRQLLQRAADLFLSAPPVHPRPEQTARLLGQLRDQLATHFALEESFGYFEQAVDVAPHLSERADVLRSEHQSLSRAICDLTDEAEQLCFTKPAGNVHGPLGLRYRTFHQQFEVHEAGENELIQQAYNDDLGVGD